MRREPRHAPGAAPVSGERGEACCVTRAAQHAPALPWWWRPRADLVRHSHAAADSAPRAQPLRLTASVHESTPAWARKHAVFVVLAWPLVCVCAAA